MDSSAAGGQAAAAPRPSIKFTRTCSLLRQFIKERGTLGIEIKMTAKQQQQQPIAAMLEAKNRHSSDTHTSSSPPVILPDLNGSVGPTVSPSPPPAAPQPRVLSSTAAAHAAAVCKPSADPQAPAPQMTIFYAGKVFIFDNFPQDKARQFMAAAASARGVASSSSFAASIASGNNNIQNQSCAAAPPSTKDVNKPPMTIPVHHHVQGPPQPQPQAPPPHIPILPSGSDLPIARRVSLNRFLEKRKDRISSKAPYQVAGSPDPMAASKPHQASTSTDSPSPSIGTGDTSAGPSSSKSFPPPPPNQHGAVLLPEKIIEGARSKIYTEAAATAAASNNDDEEPSSSTAVPWLGLAPPPSKPPL